MGVSGWRWQAPPGWPAPPSGWQPPRDWRPDPAWPAPPHGWQWWRKAPRTRWQTVRLAALVVLPGTAVLALPVAATISSSVDGCGSFDPTDPANYSVVNIHNDTTSTVTVRDCTGNYCLTVLPVRLTPGQHLTDDAACHSTGPDMTSWKVTGRGGAVLGYIAVATPRKRDGLSFSVSRASPDRRSPTPAD